MLLYNEQDVAYIKYNVFKLELNTVCTLNFKRYVFI